MFSIFNISMVGGEFNVVNPGGECVSLQIVLTHVSQVKVEIRIIVT